MSFCNMLLPGGEFGCTGSSIETYQGSAYYPNENHTGSLDMAGIPLMTLQVIVKTHSSHSALTLCVFAMPSVPNLSIFYIEFYISC